MRMYVGLLLLATYAAATTTVSEQDEKNLKAHIASHNTGFHPHPHSGDGSHEHDVVVSFAIKPTRLVKVDLHDKLVEMDVVVVMRWHDENFEWAPANFGGITYKNMNADEMWTPDIMALDSSNEFTALHNGDFKVHINSSGHCLYAIPVEFHFHCEDVKEHMDAHENFTCAVEFMSWTYAADEVSLEYVEVNTKDQSKIPSDFKIPHLDDHHAHLEYNREFKIVETDHKEYSRQYDGFPGHKYESIEFDFTVEHYHC